MNRIHRRMARGLAAAATLALLSRGGAQEPPERERVFCDPTDPCNQCPGRFCACVDATLEVTFDGDTASVLEYEAFREGLRIDTVIVTETRTRGIQGWSYAVEHEDAYLTLLDVSVDGTEAERAKDGGFVVASMFNIEACLPADPGCMNPVPGTGYISAIVLHLVEFAELPLGRNKICAATYTLASDPGPNGTLIQVVDRRLTNGGPPVDVVFGHPAHLPVGVDGGYPTSITDGWLKRKGDGTLESCDNHVDDDGDGRTDCEDWDCLSWPTCIPEDRAPGRTDCSPENCGNSEDDDGDGATDCRDPDCWELCRVPREICANSLDDDGDGLRDCSDPDCQLSPSCKPVEVCDNHEDDDRDGFADCDDTDCYDSPICSGPERCGSFRDEDQDGLVDCDDPDCAAAGDCLPGPERMRLFCDASDPENRCVGDHPPWEKCRCVPDILQVTLGGETESVLEYEAFEEGARVDSTIVLDTKSWGIQGWTFAVEHDDSFLTLVDATMDGTDALDAFAPSGGFRQIAMEHIETCAPDDPNCNPPVPGSGYIVAVVLALTTPEVLWAQRRNSLVRAQYALAADPGPDGTLVRLVHRRLRQRNSPPTGINLTITGWSRAPTTLVDGWVKAQSTAGGPGSETSFRRGDADRSGRISVLDAVIIIRVLLGKAEPVFDCDDALDVTDDGRVDVIDSIRLLRFLLDHGSDLPAPFPGCGTDPTADLRGLACRESGCEV